MSPRARKVGLFNCISGWHLRCIGWRHIPDACLRFQSGLHAFPLAHLDRNDAALSHRYGYLNVWLLSVRVVLAGFNPGISVYQTGASREPKPGITSVRAAGITHRDEDTHRAVVISRCALRTSVFGEGATLEEISWGDGRCSTDRPTSSAHGNTLSV